MRIRSTRADVAQRAGVSKTTVTYVLSDRYDIAIPEPTRERVRAVARELGYTPHPAARALASGRTHAVSIAFPTGFYAHYARILQEFERHADAAGYQIVASTVGRVSLDKVGPNLRALASSFSDGVVLVDVPAAFLPYVAGILPAEKPFVSAGAFVVPSIDNVQVDLKPGAVAALEHLLSANPRRLAFFCPGAPDVGSIVSTFAASGAMDPREEAYREVLTAAGRPLELIPGSPHDREISLARLRIYAARHGWPDAIFCFNDEMAISAHRVARESGLHIPADVLILGCDGNLECEYQEPPLSTIVQPVDRMCRTAWSYMMNRLEKPDSPIQHTRVDAKLEVRQSSRR